MTPTKWTARTNAIGFRTKFGKYGGETFAHRVIALYFASWISLEVEGEGKKFPFSFAKSVSIKENLY